LYSKVLYNAKLCGDTTMSQPRAEQLQQDLETLRSVVGTDLPFDKTDTKFA